MLPIWRKLGPGDWHSHDRYLNTETWKSANVYNLQRENGASEYSTIGQRTDFYSWFQSAMEKKGSETRWAGAAAVVSRAVQAMKLLAQATGDTEVRDFAENGNRKIFEGIMPKLRDLYNGAVLRGERAKNWDANTLSYEQSTLVQPFYDAAKTGGYFDRIEAGAKQEGWFRQTGGSVMGLPPFRGDLMKPSDRWAYGMRNMGYDANSSDMPRAAQ